jgi:hypothetical protein
VLDDTVVVLCCAGSACDVEGTCNWGASHGAGVPRLDLRHRTPAHDRLQTASPLLTLATTHHHHPPRRPRPPPPRHLASFGEHGRRGSFSLVSRLREAPNQGVDDIARESVTSPRTLTRSLTQSHSTQEEMFQEPAQRVRSALAMHACRLRGRPEMRCD